MNSFLASPVPITGQNLTRGCKHVVSHFCRYAHDATSVGLDEVARTKLLLLVVALRVLSTISRALHANTA